MSIAIELYNKASYILGMLQDRRRNKRRIPILYLTAEQALRRHYKVRSLDELRAVAELYGCELVTASLGELLLDLDEYPGDANGYVRWRLDKQRLLDLVEEKFKIDNADFWRSRNGRLHVKLSLAKSLGRDDAVALQAALGSDPVREVLAVWEGYLFPHDTRSLFRPLGTTPFKGDTTEVPENDLPF